MKFLLLCISIILSSYSIASTPQQILQSEGYRLLLKESDGEVYYRPREVKKEDGIVWYSTTKFFTKTTKNVTKYSLKSEYKVMGCKEKKVAIVGIHLVPFTGKASYKDLSKTLTGKSFKSLTKVDSKVHSIICQ